MTSPPAQPDEDAAEILPAWSEEKRLDLACFLATALGPKHVDRLAAAVGASDFETEEIAAAEELLAALEAES